MHGRSGRRLKAGRRGFCWRLLFVILLTFGACLYTVATLSAAQPAAVRTVVQSGHTIDIVSMAFARDESIFASLDGFGRVKVWQLPEGRLLTSWKINGENTADGGTDNALIAFDGTGRLVAIENNILSRWDPLTGRLEERKKLGFDAEAGLAISLNGSILASWRLAKAVGTNPGKFKIDLWNVQTGRLMRSLEDTGECDVLLSPSGSAAGCFRAAGTGYSLTMWHTGDGSLIRSGSIDISSPETGGSGPPKAVALNRDGSLTVFHREPARGSAIASLEVRRTSDMSLVKTIPVAGVDHPPTFSEDGKFFIYFDRPDGTKTEMIKVLNTARWESVYESRKEMTTSLAISPTSRFIAEGAGGMMGSGAYYLTYLITLHDLNRGSRKTIYEEGKWTDHLAISPDGTCIVLNEQRGMPDNPREEDIVLSRLRLVSLRDGTMIWEKRGEEGDRFKNIGYSQSGKHLIARDLENVHIWEMPSGKPAGKFNIAYDKFNTGLAISPDGRFFAAVDGSNPVKPAVYLFRSSDGARVMALQRVASRGEKTTTEALAFSPDGRYVAKTVFRDVPSTGPAGIPAPGQRVQVELWSTGGREKPRIIDTGRYSDRESARSLDRQPLSTDVLAFASDGKHLLVGRKVVRLSDGRLAAVVETPADPALGSLGPFYEGAGRSLSISPRGGIYAQQTQDGGIRIADLTGGNERATLYTFPKSSVTVTPEGFFSGSGEFDKEVHFARGKDIYDFNQFYDAFYRPDLVMMKLRGEDISGYSSGLSFEEALRNPPPEVSIVTPASGGKTDLRRLTVRVRVSDTGGGIGDVRIFNNGKLVHSRGIYRIAATGPTGEAASSKDPSSPYRIAARGPVTVSARPSGNRQTLVLTQAPPQHGTQDLFYDIELIGGQNVLSLAAFNGPNTVMSAMKTITVEADVPQRKPRLFSLIIGNDHFKDKQIDLSFAVKDAKDFAALIRKASGTLFEKVVVEVLADASKTQFVKSINDIAATMHPEDVFLFYAASHGLARDDLYYLFTSGFDGTTLDGETSISSVELMEFSKTIPSLQQIYALDTCQAGGAGSVVLSLYDSRISVLAKSLGMHIMAGSKTYQQAIDNYEGNGLFTHFLLKGFGGRADLNRDGKVSIVEMNPYLVQSMKAASQGRQEPFIRNFGRDLIITSPAEP